MQAVVRIEDLIPSFTGLEAVEAGAPDMEWEDPRGPKQFWGMVLLLAVRDGASSLHLHPWRPDRGMTYIVSGVQYEMVPPPSDHGIPLVQSARCLFMRNSSWLRRLLRPAEVSTAASFVLDVWGNLYEWDVVYWDTGARMGVDFYRANPPEPQVPSVVTTLNYAQP